jgi:gliding motility-associated-like protein
MNIKIKLSVLLLAAICVINACKKDFPIPEQPVVAAPADTSHQVNHVNPNSTLTVCLKSGQVTVDATVAGAKYLWTPGNDTTHNKTITTAGNYKVLITRETSTIGNIKIESCHDTIKYYILSDTTICHYNGDVLRLTAAYSFAGQTFEWNPGTVHTQEYLATINQGYTLRIAYTDSIGSHTIYDSINVVACARPAKTVLIATGANPANCINTGDSVFLDATKAGTYTYLWSPTGEITPKIKITQAGNYAVTITRNIVDSAFVIAEICTEGGLKIPQGFSPNGDGVNDTWKITGTDITSYSLKIYDRFGNEVFSTVDINSSWDGTSKGNNMIDGTYYYAITYKIKNGSENTLKGYLLLIR